MHSLPVRDETLRLALAKDHQSWLQSEIRDRVIAIVILLIAALAVIGSVIFVMYEPEEPSDVLWVTESTPRSAIDDYQAQGFVVRFREPTDASQNSGNINVEEHGIAEIARLVGAVMAIIITIGAPIFIVRALFDIRKLRLWHRDHEAFLRAHGFDPDEGAKSG